MFPRFACLAVLEITCCGTTAARLTVVRFAFRGMLGGRQGSKRKVRAKCPARGRPAKYGTNWLQLTGDVIKQHTPAVPGVCSFRGDTRCKRKVRTCFGQPTQEVRRDFPMRTTNQHWPSLFNEWCFLCAGPSWSYNFRLVRTKCQSKTLTKLVVGDSAKPIQQSHWRSKTRNSLSRIGGCLKIGLSL